VDSFFETEIFRSEIDFGAQSRARLPRDRQLGSIKIWVTTTALALSTITTVVGSADLSDRTISPPAIAKETIESPPVMPVDLATFATQLQSLAVTQGINYQDVLRQASSVLTDFKIEPRSVLTEQEIALLLDDDETSE
jgi:hypothetical protein